ncbi:MAG: AI-2E family transporter, partial [Butyrivibrio sp.]|nr:AI-2E family transporter [Butyrivibrio sp.]
MLLSNIGVILGGFSAVYSFIRPVALGIVIAYIVNPMAKFFENGLFKKIKNNNTKWKLSVAATLIAIILAISLLFVALVPQLADSISTFISNLGGYVESTQQLLEEFQISHGEGMLHSEFKSLADFVGKILDGIGNTLTGNMDSVVSSSMNAGRGLFDGFIAFILAIYLLLDKKRLSNGFSRIMKLILKEKSYNNSAEFLSRCNDILIRYISFDIVDGIIVGVVNAIFMLIAGLPYSILISVIVGLTNLAPTFGPIVGCVIGALILVLVNPWYAVWFIIFTIILQTIDGYILKPRLFGESLGVSPLMILVSIVLGGRLFGVVGILLAIPFAAIFDFVWKDFILKKLEERKSKMY